MDLKQYTYFAFISYKREDEKWAKWLQQKLESYSLPTAIRKKNPELPNKIRPVFRDQSELSGGNLKAEIEKGLNGSKYLIVICSPRSAKSPWVSKEIQYFIDQGRADYIIPFIIGGTPNAFNPKDECFPEGLRQLRGEKEILGININEMGRDAAAIKVIARMFDLRFDVLYRRFERDRKRRQVTINFFAIASFLTLLLIGWLYFDRSEAYKNLDKKNDELTNTIRELSETQRKLKIGNEKLVLANESIQQINTKLIKNKERLSQTIFNLELTQDSLVKSNRIAIINEKKAVENLILAENSEAQAILKNVNILILKEELVEAATIFNKIVDEMAKYDNQTQSLIYSTLRNLYLKYNYGSQYDNILAHNGQICDLGFSADGSLVSTSSNDGTVKVWSTLNGQLIKEFILSSDVGNIWSNSDVCTFYESHNQLHPNYRDSYYKTYSSISTGYKVNINKINGKTNLSNNIYSPDGTLSVRQDKVLGMLLVYNGDTLKSIVDVGADSIGSIKHIEFTYDNSKMLIFGNHDIINVYVKEYSSDGKLLRHIDLSQEDYVATQGCIYLPNTHDILYIDYEKGIQIIKEDGRITPYEDIKDINTIAIHPDANIIAMGTKGGRLILHHYVSTQPKSADNHNSQFFLKEMCNYDHGMSIYEKHVRADYNGIILKSYKDIAYIENSNDGSILKLIGHQNNIGNVIFNRAHDMVITRAFDNTIRFWSMENGAEIDSLRIRVDGYGNQSIICSPDDQYLISSSDRMIYVWDIKSGGIIFSMPYNDVMYSCLSEDGSKLLFTSGFGNKTSDVKCVDFLNGDNLIMWFKEMMPKRDK